MLKETIKYTDYNGVERTEDFWFHLSKAELMEWEMGTTGGLTEMIKRIVDAQKLAQLEEILYGKDGTGEDNSVGAVDPRLPLPDEIATLMKTSV